MLYSFDLPDAEGDNNGLPQMAQMNADRGIRGNNGKAATAFNAEDAEKAKAAEEIMPKGQGLGANRRNRTLPGSRFRVLGD